MSIRNQMFAALVGAAAFLPGFARADYFPACHVLQAECEKMAIHYAKAHKPGGSPPFNAGDCAVAAADAEGSGYFRMPAMSQSPPLSCQK